MYGLSIKAGMEFDEAINKVKEELKNEGFGVMSEINIKDKLKKKLGVEFDNYVILGACNPSLAHKALLSEKEIGLMLPCNVIIYENNGVNVSTILPTAAMGMIDNEELKSVAQEVENKLTKVIDNLRDE